MQRRPRHLGAANILCAGAALCAVLLAAGTSRSKLSVLTQDIQGPPLRVEVISVGVDNYGDVGGLRLANARADAGRIARAITRIGLREGGDTRYVNVSLLLDATTAETLEAIERSGQRPADLRIMFFAGAAAAQPSGPVLYFRDSALGKDGRACPAVRVGDLVDRLLTSGGAAVVVVDGLGAESVSGGTTDCPALASAAPAEGRSKALVVYSSQIGKAAVDQDPSRSEAGSPFALALEEELAAHPCDDLELIMERVRVSVLARTAEALRQTPHVESRPSSPIRLVTCAR